MLWIVGLLNPFVSFLIIGFLYIEDNRLLFSTRVDKNDNGSILIEPETSPPLVSVPIFIGGDSLFGDLRLVANMLDFLFFFVNFFFNG